MKSSSVEPVIYFSLKTGQEYLLNNQELLQGRI